jgi:chloramphenicol-sensitive protein RarD
VLALVGGWTRLRTLSPRGWLTVSAAAGLIAVNWGVFIYGVAIDQVVEVALGFYINPLASVLLGMAVLGELLRPAQWVAVVIAVIAVLVLIVDSGHVPWIGLVLAGTFGLYALLKKTVPLPSTASLTAEGLVLGPLAAGFLLWLQVTGRGTFTSYGAGHAVLLMAAGPVTAVPLLLFGMAAQRIPLSMLGILQYLTPTLQFGWGVLVLGESMSAGRWIGFGLIWAALLTFTADLVKQARRDRMNRATAVCLVAAEAH